MEKFNCSLGHGEKLAFYMQSQPPTLQTRLGTYFPKLKSFG